MKNYFNAIHKSDKSDRIFLIDLISQICDYAIDNNMQPTETITTIANNMLMLTSISNFDNWKGENENDSKGNVF